MITLKQFMEIINYRITEGSEYQWQCYGYKAYCLDSWNGDHEGHGLSIIFDRDTQTVYEVQAHDYQRDRAYRMINPEYREAYEQEARDRGITTVREAWEDVDYVDLDVDEDFVDKARAMVEGRDYDTKVSIQVDFTDEELLEYMKLAHDLDITFNQLVERALVHAIEKHGLDHSHSRTA